MKLGEKIKQLRLAKGYSQTQLASILKISQHCLSQYESGAREVKYSMLEDIMKAVGYSVNFENKMLEENIENEINNVMNELKLGYEEHKDTLETLVVILDVNGIIVLHNKCAEGYLEAIKDSEFICTLTKEDFEKGFEHIEEHIKTNCFRKMNSKLYQIKNFLYGEFSFRTDMEFSIDIVNDYIYVNNIKVCRFDFVESFIDEVDSVVLKLIDGSSIYIVMSWVKNEKPYISQIYREKYDEYTKEEFTHKIYDADGIE